MPNCFHRNIFWEDFFKEPKKNKAYCLDCNDDKSDFFSRMLQIWYSKKIQEWLKDNNLKSFEFKFLKKEGLW